MKADTQKSRSSAVIGRGPYASRACNFCRVRKVKCNGEKPSCGSCNGAGQECIWGSEPSKRSSTAQYMASLKERIDDLDKRVASLESKSTQYQDVAAESFKSRPHSETEVVPLSTSTNGTLDEESFGQFVGYSEQVERVLGNNMLRLVDQMVEQRSKDAHNASSFPLSNVPRSGRVDDGTTEELHRLATSIDSGFLRPPASLQQTSIPGFPFLIDPNGCQVQPSTDCQPATLAGVSGNTSSWGTHTGVANWTPLCVDHGHFQQGSVVVQPLGQSQGSPGRPHSSGGMWERNRRTETHNAQFIFDAAP